MTYRAAPIVLQATLRGRAVLLVPAGNPRDWRLFAAHADGAVRTLDERYGPIADLAPLIATSAARFGLSATMHLGEPDGPIEFEVRG